MGGALAAARGAAAGCTIHTAATLAGHAAAAVEVAWLMPALLHPAAMVSVMAMAGELASSVAIATVPMMTMRGELA